MQLQAADFFDFNRASQSLSSVWIPYQKVNHIIYSKHNLFSIEYSTTIRRYYGKTVYITFSHF